MTYQVLKSHAHPDIIDLSTGEMIWLLNLRRPVLTHTRSPHAKWIGLDTADLILVDMEIGYLFDSVWIAEGIEPGMISKIQERKIVWSPKCHQLI